MVGILFRLLSLPDLQPIDPPTQMGYLELNIIQFREPIWLENQRQNTCRKTSTVL